MKKIFIRLVILFALVVLTVSLVGCPLLPVHPKNMVGVWKGWMGNAHWHQDVQLYLLPDGTLGPESGISSFVCTNWWVKRYPKDLDSSANIIKGSWDEKSFSGLFHIGDSDSKVIGQFSNSESILNDSISKGWLPILRGWISYDQAIVGPLPLPPEENVIHFELYKFEKD
jgi:hypothetical protein